MFFYAANISFAMKAIDPWEKNRIVCKIHQIVYSHFAIKDYAIRLTLCNPNTNTPFLQTSNQPANGGIKLPLQVAASGPRKTCFEQRLAEFWISGVSAPSAALIVPRRINGPIFNYLCHFFGPRLVSSKSWHGPGLPTLFLWILSCCRHHHQVVDNICVQSRRPH